ncbi:MAG TPA: helix-turn-helix domain-containing protein [Candidatus Elarobacter sp.]|jgi:AcrR family transcriptional regulator|nr:helix-turn-helix domain-containing protein [Candidatus Elarobacter sp.]
MLIAGHRSHAGVEETRAKILTAARELFECNGTRGTTTREVADRAGVNEATLFRHFGSKRALLDAMREQACGVEEFRSILASLPGEDLATDLRILAYEIVDGMVARRGMMCVSLAEDAAGTAESPEWRGPSQIKAELASYFEAKSREGLIKGEPAFVSRYFLGMLFSYVVGRKLWDSTVPDRAVLDRLVDIFLNGVTA